MSAPPPEHLVVPLSPLRFGPSARFELQPAERRLLVEGRPAALGARALDVLIALASRPDQLVSKHELLDRVWSGLVVEESNLHVQMSQLRKVLGGDIIATVPGRGYRFVAPTLPAEARSIAGAEQPSRAQPGSAMSSPPGPAQASSASASVPPPARRPSLVGRDADLAQLEALLASSACVTLAGPAGVGKTSLARVAAARIDAGPGRCVWVDMAPLNLAAQLPGALARALGMTLAETDAPAALRRALAEQAGSRPLLLVLDNAEHLIDACAALVGSLVPLPGLQLLVTSQLALAVAGEQVQRLAPLALAAPHASAAEPGDGALALLIERIRAVQLRFAFEPQTVAVLARICAQLDGLPLALEMAAARIPVMGAQAVHDALDQRFALLTRGRRDAADRHRTLHQALDWSYQLLTPAEQQLFRTLGCFAGGFTLELALAVLGDAWHGGDGDAARWAAIDGLGTLVDRSLVVASTDDPPRYRLLDSMRAFALQALAASGDELAAVRGAQARAVAALFARHSPDDAAIAALCQAEMENAREAIAWAQVNELQLAARISAGAAQVSTFTVWRGECTQWLQALHSAMDSDAGAALPAEVQARWWTEFARSASFIDDPRAVTAARRAFALWQPLQQPSQAMLAAVVWVRAQRQAGAELDAACAALQAQAAAIAAPTALDRLRLHGALTKAALTRGDLPAVLEGRLAEVALAAELGSLEMVEAAESNVVLGLNGLSRHAEALTRARALLARIDQRSGDASPNMPWVLVGLLAALLHTGHAEEAQRLVPRAWAASRRFVTLTVLLPLPWLCALRGRFEAAAQLAGHLRQRHAAQGLALDSSDEALLQQAERLTVAALGQAAADAQQAAGRLLDEDAAVALAAG